MLAAASLLVGAVDILHAQAVAVPAAPAAESPEDDGPPIDPNATPETRKALELEQQADAVLYFAGSQNPQPDNAGTFYIAKPDPNPAAVDPATGALSIGKLKPLPMPELEGFAKGASGGKALAVIVLNKIAQRWPEHVLMDATDKMTAALQAAGYARVVFEFDEGGQRSIYYDTDG